MIARKIYEFGLVSLVFTKQEGWVFSCFCYFLTFFLLSVQNVYNICLLILLELKNYQSDLLYLKQSSNLSIKMVF